MNTVADRQTPETSSGAETVLARIATSRRYRTVADSLVLRLAGEELPKSRNLAEAEKRTKRRLHQIFGAYSGQPDYPSLLVRITSAHERDDGDELRALCRAAMEQHASTRERLPILDRFYDEIFALTGVPSSIVDLACGLNPLALPWMNLSNETRYTACDIDSALVGFVAGFLDLMGIEYQVELCDIVAAPPHETCDLALLLKSVPCLDQQDPTAASRVLRSIEARHYVITFPTHSLGGRSKGMARNYRTRFEQLMDEPGWTDRQVNEIELPGELIYVVGGPMRDVGRGMRDANQAYPGMHPMLADQGSVSSTSFATRRGDLAIPAFLPDATRAGVRGVTAEDLRSVGIPAIVVNAFHLLRRPGVRVIQAHGGIHTFMDWHGPILSDSGGFQVYSLIRQNPDYGVIRPNEVIFREPDTGERWTLTPERVIQMQFQLGSDIVVCLDDCTDVGAGEEEQKRAVERTIRWAKRCKEEYERQAGQMKRREPPLIFAVVQGGASEALRRECAQALVEIGFDGFGFGGWPLAEDGSLLTDVLGWVADALPPDAPKHALGIGSPEHVVATRALGYTTFDSSFPTRDARHNRLYVFREGWEHLLRPGESFHRTLYILDSDYHADREPVDPSCDCPLCTRYSRAYLHHLFKIGDTTAERLATLHNLRFYARMMAMLP